MITSRISCPRDLRFVRWNMDRKCLKHLRGVHQPRGTQVIFGAFWAGMLYVDIWSVPKLIVQHCVYVQLSLS